METESDDFLIGWRCFTGTSLPHNYSNRKFQNLHNPLWNTAMNQQKTLKKR